MQAASSAGQTMLDGDGTSGRWKHHGVSSSNSDQSFPPGTLAAGEERFATNFQNHSANGAVPSRPAEPTPLAGTRPDPFPTPATRRRQSSFRERRVLQPPGTLQASPSKRLAYNGQSNLLHSHERNASLVPQDTHVRQSSTNYPANVSVSQSSPARRREVSQTSVPFDFLPSVNFDDLHSSLGSSDPAVKSLPSPSRASQGFRPASITVRPVLGGPSKTVDSSGTGPSIAMKGSSLRRQNSSARESGQAIAGNEGTTSVTGPVTARARRKTYFPAAGAGANASEPTIRAPRKSVGPGILTVESEIMSQPHRRPTLMQAGFRELVNSGDLLSSPSRRNVSDALTGSDEGTNRHAKTKSLQPPPRKILVPEQFYTPTGTPEQNAASPVNLSRSPGKPNAHRMMTPSSSKRLSVMPGSAHATGLGARTISPTDTRRLKRMSMMPNPPPVPFTPPTPQPEALFSMERPNAPSPSIIPRKSVTPSSSRTTPDPNRKSYSSGVSNSSTTSYNSCIASSNSLRNSQNFSTSRLPTLKTRNDNVPVGDDEVVPPVPAIPKAYESPKGEFEEHSPFFSARKSSLGQETSSLNGTLATAELPSPVELEPSKTDRSTRQKRIPNPEMEPATERKPNLGANAANRRTLQPLRLPPLNLLPLSTPTTSKIAALQTASVMKNEGTITPPPKPGAKATPTTPMTASKANFGRNYYEDDTAPLPAGIRSSSSHYNMKAEALAYRAASSSSTAVIDPPDPSVLTSSRIAMSPFGSSSLPKSSGEFSYARLEKSSTFDMGTEAKPTRLTGPRLQRPRKASKDDASSMETTSSIDAGTHSIGSTLRRKLSLTRKRSASKAQTAAERDGEAPPKPPKHDDMPPPKLPASATWNGPLLTSPGPSQQSNSSRAARVASNSNANVHQDRVRSSTFDAATLSKQGSKPAELSNAGQKRTARATLEGAPNNNALSLKDFLREAKTMELTLDRDDLSAEDEMKRLASKRKETEAAAKQFDALKRRATAKDRVGPTSALRMAQLNIFERGEIIDYKDIYFCGTKDAKKHVGDLTTTVANFGYDDDRGDYNIVTGDHLSYRYEMIDVLGKGSFGQVVRCIDHKNGVLVAIKIIRNKKRFHQQALVEVELLQKLREWDPGNKHSMVNFVQQFYFRGHLCISTELLGMNLYEFIKCHDFRGFSLKLIRRFTKQMLSCLVLLKSKNVIHCDLKPENILLAHPTRSEIKVIDFGSSCLENEKVYTYIQSRFYRSPEVILGMTYGMPIDMWSLGCILAELLTGYPIFPGENEQEQLACIMEVFGPPEKHLIEKSTRKKLFFDSNGKPRITVSTKGKRRRPSSKSLQQVLKCEDEVFLDFISRCLRWDPDRRLKPDEAVQHEFITGKVVRNNPRPRTAPSNQASSPIKRYNSVSQTPASTRPLPEPPVTSLKNGTGMRTRDTTVNIPTPSKSAAPALTIKRNSTMTGMQPNGAGAGIGASTGAGAGVKRTLNGAAVPASALPRVTSAPRVGTGSGKNVDLAAAAAVASLKPK